MRVGLKGIGFVVQLSVEGAIFGSVGIALLAMIAWGITRIFKGNKSLGWALSAFGLGYCSTLIFTVLGLLFSLILNWNTSVAFGVSGVLWATGPMIASIKEMSRDNTALSVIVATICSGLLLLGWVLLGNA
jgi:Kef-type K+ transport system membrane component KefB